MKMGEKKSEKKNGFAAKKRIYITLSITFIGLLIFLFEISGKKFIYGLPTPTPTSRSQPTPIPTSLLSLGNPLPTNTPIPQSTLTPACNRRASGDANCDGSIDDSDYNIWRCEFLGNGQCKNPLSNLSASFNLDQKVDLIDFEIWRKNRFVSLPTPTPTRTPTPQPNATNTPTPTSRTLDDSRLSWGEFEKKIIEKVKEEYQNTVDVSITFTEYRVFSDSCLGCGRSGTICAQVLQNGVRVGVKITHNNGDCTYVDYRARTNGDCTYNFNSLMKCSENNGCYTCPSYSQYRACTNGVPEKDIHGCDTEVCYQPSSCRGYLE